MQAEDFEDQTVLNMKIVLYFVLYYPQSNALANIAS
uniref:Uncharacterized protein n=1 Tax=Lepeophtheirus salmonis TaxID=72036 RepID=A0A0K2UTD6_LEPSM